jgi:hypothetical protein
METTSSLQVSDAPRFGRVCAPQEKVPTDVWAYKLDAEGNETQYIGRVCGRKVGEILADVQKATKRSNYEYMTLGGHFKYIQATPENNRGYDIECPEFHSLAVYVTHGGSEGHLVHVDIMSRDAEGNVTAKNLIFVKTFGGLAYARKLSNRIADLMGVR